MHREGVYALYYSMISPLKNTLYTLLCVMALTAMAPAVLASDTDTGAWTDAEIDAEIGRRMVELKQLEVRPKKVKYSKKNNPAVDFQRRLVAARQLTDPAERNPYYNYGKYERFNLGLLDFKVDSAGRFGYLMEYMDTSAISGLNVLNLTVKEKLSDHHFRRDPRTAREVVRAVNRHGLDDMATDDESIQTLVADVFSEVDIYDSDITMLRTRFPSPLGRVATDFYKFYLTDTVADPEYGDSLVVLSFVPKTVTMQAFNGRIYVVKDDSTMFIRRLELNVPKAANVNFLTAMRIEQEYERAPHDGSRLKTRDEMTAEFNVLTQSLIGKRTTIYHSHSFAPADSAILADPRPVIQLNDLRSHDDDYWVRYRPVEMQHGEANMAGLLARLRQDKLYYWTERTLKLLVGKYVFIGGREKSKVDIGPLLSAISFNDLEGLRLKAGFRTTPRLSPRWFTAGYVARGFKDHRWKYSGEVEYSWINKRLNAREFPVRSLRLSHTYDVDQLGQHYFTTDDDAFFLSLKRMPNDRMTYMRRTDLEYKYEFYNQFSVVARLRHERQEATRYVDFTTGLGQSMSHFSQTSVHVELRYAPGEKFYQGNNSRRSITPDAPVFRLAHTFAPRGVLGNRWGINKTEFAVEKRFRLAAWGYLDTSISGGHVWGQSVFASLLIPNANISYIIQPKSYALMNPMEFINSSYAAAEVTYWLNGALFNYVPGLNRLKLREVVGIRALWGHLNSKNDPERNPHLLLFPADVHTQRMRAATPYTEVYAGIDNIFRILRVDYVRRLTYKHNPGIDLWGIRVGLHFSF